MPAVTGWRSGEPTLADVRAEFPGWRCFRGINGLYYAQYEPTGEQVSGEDPLDLRDQIKAAEARHLQDGALSLPGVATAPGRARAPAL